eukprot:CAMPEP_0174377984 /NCGR_PEP_ID=MMETSP0811_2-20130205/121771_1 /TAXON_ID=73025 ORGANISM="Eutreptiella gymnastica-like, Strain CCMP1594" /NCGR_SAMPLE_ID=MMETSP0811_2 /ASSEMBLY_ACC=CAM_ASM_000667 /LENGTH=104 /DNA_ID=CAMNT_0015530099 /DNA_START=4789 /DNA_END=5103 /DNA_ORIENTATION=+
MTAESAKLPTLHMKEQTRETARRRQPISMKSGERDYDSFSDALRKKSVQQRTVGQQLQQHNSRKQPRKAPGSPPVASSAAAPPHEAACCCVYILGYFENPPLRG